MLLLFAVGLHFGLGFAEAYWRYFQNRDAMAQAARFANDRSDSAIRERLASVADSLDLPADASDVTIRRSARGVAIEARYVEVVKLPGSERRLHLNPRVEPQ